MKSKERPTSVTVIGWVWIVIACLMLLSALLGLSSLITLSQILEDQEKGPLNIFAAASVIQICFAVLGIISGIHFYKMKYWARNIIEILSWILFIFCFGFCGLFLFSILSATGNMPPGFMIVAIIINIVTFAMFCVPLGIMIKYLRSSIVKKAMIKKPNKILQQTATNE